MSSEILLQSSRRNMNVISSSVLQNFRIVNCIAYACACINMFGAHLNKFLRIFVFDFTATIGVEVLRLDFYTNR